MSGKLILIELNEINFDVVQRYLDQGLLELPAMRSLLAGKSIRTSSEQQYERLEPWIQWVSVHTGKSFNEHGIFRLGDMAQSSHPQMFEELEEKGRRIGAVSPMNAPNRLRQPGYFIPDPWTKTPTDGSWWSRKLASAISQAVNDNSQAKLDLRSALYLLLGLLRYARPVNYLEYIRLAAASRRQPWKKALFLDLFLHDLHLRLLHARGPDLSVLFLNAGAHIQHHYFFNAKPLRSAVAMRNPDWYVGSEEDPVADMLRIYDRIIGDYQRLTGRELIVATGLSQAPYDRVKFYYRLKNHDVFLRALGISFREVHPRMTRDFLVEFDSEAEAAAAEAVLAGVVVSGDGSRLFGDIDNRGASLFVTLTYPSEVIPETEFRAGAISERLAPHLAFVAIKNGMHQETGFAFFSDGVAPFAPESNAHVKFLHGSITNFLR